MHLPFSLWAIIGFLAILVGIAAHTRILQQWLLSKKLRAIFLWFFFSLFFFFTTLGLIFTKDISDLLLLAPLTEGYSSWVNCTCSEAYRLRRFGAYFLRKDLKEISFIFQWLLSFYASCLLTIYVEFYFFILGNYWTSLWIVLALVFEDLVIEISIILAAARSHSRTCWLESDACFRIICVCCSHLWKRYFI